MISDISEKADRVKFLEQVTSYISLRVDKAQYYVQAGRWTFPGGSIPAVVTSGRNAARLVLKEAQ